MKMNTIPTMHISIDKKKLAQCGPSNPVPTIQKLYKRHHPHWYKIITEECPVCGRGRTTRERVYGSPPPHQEKYEYHQTYDYCMEY